MTTRAAASTLSKWLPRRDLTANKGSVGRIYIVAGSSGMAGSGILAGWGAVSAGAGLVRLGTVKSCLAVAAKRGPLEMTSEALPETRSGQLDSKKTAAIKKNILKFNPSVWAMGPGIGNSPNTRKVVKDLLKEIQVPLVLDADGLNVLAELKWKGPISKSPVVLTPHPGELARLLGCSIKQIQADRAGSAKKAAIKFKCVVLLKGHKTIVTAGRQAWENTTGNPAMASAGMGDVLTGLIAALWGQMPQKDLVTGLKAAVLGAYLHGAAGDKAARKIGSLSIQASRLADFIPGAIHTLKARSGQGGRS